MDSRRNRKSNDRRTRSVGSVAAGSSRARSAAVTPTRVPASASVVCDADVAGPAVGRRSAVDLDRGHAEPPPGSAGTSRSSGASRSRAAATGSASRTAGTAGRPADRRCIRWRPGAARGALRRGGAGRSRRADARWSSSRRADARERIRPFDEQRLVPPDVADPGERSLVEEGLGDRHRGPGGIAEAAERLVGGLVVEGRIQEVRPERRDRRVQRLGSLLEQLDDRRVEADGDGAGHLDDEAGSRFGPAPRARPAGSDATSRSSGGASAARGRCRTGSAGSCRATRPPRSSSRRLAQSEGPAVAPGRAVTVRPTRCGRSPAAVRKSVSPSGTDAARGSARAAQREPAVGGAEARRDQPLAERRLADREPVDLRDDQLANPAVLEQTFESPQRRLRDLRSRPPRAASEGSRRRAPGRARPRRRRATT